MNVTEPCRTRFFFLNRVHLLHYQLNLANIRICIYCYAISTSFLLVFVYCRPPFRESDKHSISGVCSGNMCVQLSYSLSALIGLKLVIAYRSCRCVSGSYTILSPIDFNHFFLVVTIDCYQCLMILIVAVCMGFNSPTCDVAV